MVQANEPFENRTKVSGFQIVLNHSKTGHQKVRFSDESGIQVSGF